ncbi:FYN-binding protein 2 isoform X2 [Balearica regulorum gibbericeps]|uniref:FYN-binding protein 2 isoform X2 n=1 Tax=Balearica regulorum gibbericeps TaxID=100784 RepID=UPI003F6293A8
MDVEGVTDFKTLRAKFQNDSNLANKLVQPHKKPPAEIPPKPVSRGNAVSSPLPLSKKEVIILKPKDGPAHTASQPSALTQRNPLAWPRAKLGYVEPTGHNEEHKGNLLKKGLRSPKNRPEKPLPSCCTDQHGSAQTAPESPPLSNPFHHALQIWENTLSCSEKARAMLPAQRAANLYVHPCPEQRATCAPAASGRSGMRLPGSEPTLDLPAQKKDALRGSGPALPQAPRGHRGSDEAAAESAATTAFCQTGYRTPGAQPRHQKESEPPFCQPRAGKWSDSPGSKWPRIKPLPSAESLGPAPGKPARPPKFDLGPFRSAVPSIHRGNETTADEEDYLTPESAQLEEQHNYEETPTYLYQSGDTTTLCVIEVPKAEPEEHRKQKTFLSAKSRAIIEDEKEEKPSLEREKQEAKKLFKTGENEYVCRNSQTKEDGRGGMKVPQVKQDVTSTQTTKHPTPQGLAKDRAEFLSYVYVGAPKPDVERTALNQNTWQSLQAPEDIYDDIEEMQDRLSQASDASSPFASASISGSSYEETYEDVEIEGDNPAKPETDKQKRFGNLFKIEKLKLKNTRFKENLRLFSISAPNLEAVSQEDMVYDDVEVGQRVPREKDDKYKTWMPKFLMAKDDKDQRKSSGDVERNIFKVKNSNAEKSKKMGKEEKFFRETFMYDKEINVINTATAECSVASKRRVDLPVTAGEQLDVIDVTEGNAVICRNSEGRYGYVLVEHLNFRQTVLTAPRAAHPRSIPASLKVSFALPASVRVYVGQLWRADVNVLELQDFPKRFAL